MRSRKKESDAFTLIELLVVIAILGLLAGLLMPVFSRARENARRSSCASNLKQIGMGFHQYTQDYDEMLPPHRQSFPYPTPSSSNTAISWRQLTYPYVNNTQVYRCVSNPSRTSSTDSDGTITNKYPGTQDFYISYGANSRPLVLADDPADKCVKVSALASPTTLFLIGESVTNDSHLRIDTTPSTSSMTARRFFGGHLATANMLFCDGHVKSMKWDATCQTPFSWNVNGSACSGTDISRLQLADEIWAN